MCIVFSGRSCGSYFSVFAVFDRLLPVASDFLFECFIGRRIVCEGGFLCWKLLRLVLIARYRRLSSRRPLCGDIH